MSKELWFKQHLLLNLGFVPKLFGYDDDDLYALAHGKLREYTSGVEHYFGLSVAGTERTVDAFSPFLVDERLIKVMHAPFARVRYPLPVLRRLFQMSKRSLYKTVRLHIISRAHPNPWHRLPAAIDISSRLGAEKIVIHAEDIMFAAQSERLFREINHLGAKKNILICLENTGYRIKKWARDRDELEAAYNPVKLIEVIRRHNLDMYYLTLDTAHVAQVGYNLNDMWGQIKTFVRGDINSAIAHFHLVDYIPRDEFDAEVPGSGVIGIETFRRIIDDLYKMHYPGTISLEVAPLFFNQARHKLAWNIFKRVCHFVKHSMREEEEYVLETIKELV